MFPQMGTGAGVALVVVLAVFVIVILLEWFVRPKITGRVYAVVPVTRFIVHDAGRPVMVYETERILVRFTAGVVAYRRVGDLVPTPLHLTHSTDFGVFVLEHPHGWPEYTPEDLYVFDGRCIYPVAEYKAMMGGRGTVVESGKTEPIARRERPNDPEEAE